MAGSSFYVEFNGRKFDLPEDMEASITIGGLNNKADLRNGNGSVVPQKNTVPGAIRGMTPRIRTANGDLEALQDLASSTGVSVNYAGPEGFYQGTGFIVGGEDGIKQNPMTDTVESIDFVCENGKKLVRK